MRLKVSDRHLSAMIFSVESLWAAVLTRVCFIESSQVIVSSHCGVLNCALPIQCDQLWWATLIDGENDDALRANLVCVIAC